MRALLIQHICEAALEVLPEDMEAQAKAELNKKAHNAVILCLGNKILREVKYEDEDLALLLLTSLPASYEHFVETLLYGREALTLEDVMATLNSKEIIERSKAKGDDGEGLYVRGRTDHRDSQIIRRIIAGSQQVMSRKMISQALVVRFMTVLSVLLGDNKECKIRGIGKVRVQLRDRSSFVLNNVMYILELKRNLISLGTLKKRGIYNKIIVGQSQVAGELNASVEEKDSLAQVWHKRLGHMSEAGKGCLARRVESLGGKRYFLSIIDDYSKRVWVYILNFKHEAFGKFKKWKQLVENQTGRMVKKLRMDNSLEFCNQNIMR
ncbi:retrovirus-related pol polyprotein from transposon TNT 1-94 [Tanacetum coccineum]|uniref:Retrovirus-related pol polyprotein from transposon TNT 1-94 n=1 Tax=Tanacetum coccineum TaxID=301880 RepID=A0ABQ4YEU0_9ASTR